MIIDIFRSKMKDKHKIAHMKCAFNYAECSTAKRLKVGCVIVKDNRIISIGYNGMPTGWTNECEELVLWEKTIQLSQPVLKTKPEVLHAEANAITKLARSSESGENAVAFITHQPCLECSKLLYQTGISEVYYVHEYRVKEGVEFLTKCKIKLHRMKDEYFIKL